MNNLIKHHIIILKIVALLGLSASILANAQPLQQTLGETVIDKPSSHYRFERMVIESADGKKRWRINMAIPNARVPKQGFPAFYMLDGNAALMQMNQGILAELAAAARPPVLIFMGYDNDMNFDIAARTRDYTPYPQQDDSHPGGEAAAFRDAIATLIRPAISQRITIDQQAQTLWGHSYGGLFVLYTLFTRPDMFQTYVAASPSLWWQKGEILQEEKRFRGADIKLAVRLFVMQGEDERTVKASPRDKENPRVQAHLQRISVVPADSALQMAKRLQKQRGLDVHYREFSGLSHGPMLGASLRAALQESASVKFP